MNISLKRTAEIHVIIKGEINKCLKCGVYKGGQSSRYTLYIWKGKVYIRVGTGQWAYLFSSHSGENYILQYILYTLYIWKGKDKGVLVYVQGWAVGFSLLSSPWRVYIYFTSVYTLYIPCISEKWQLHHYSTFSI